MKPPATALDIAVVGGGINGIMTAWHLADAGHRVEVFERDVLMGATSSASTKLLHGGLRYLENHEFRLVREGLRERAWWIAQAPHLAHPIRLILPVYTWSRRPAWMLRIGLALYGLLAAGKSLGPCRWHDRAALLRLQSELNGTDLLGGFTFWDGQMDDRALGLWAANQVRTKGVRIHEGQAVERVDTAGRLTVAGRVREFDRVINVAGPWAKALLDGSGVASAHHLDLVRGSHLVLDRPCAGGILAEIPGERRIAFILPYQGQILVGTTEERQSLEESIAITQQETTYLLSFHNRMMVHGAGLDDITATFAGLRPLLRTAKDPGRASREYAIECHHRLITVFGGKWTTARALGDRVARIVGAGMQPP